MSDTQNIIAFQLLVAQKRGLKTVRLSSPLTVLDDHGNPVIDVDGLPHLTSRVKALAEASKIGLCATMEQVARLEAEGELALSRTSGLAFGSANLSLNSKSLNVAAIEAWKERTLDAVTATATAITSRQPRGPLRRSSRVEAAIGVMTEHIAAELGEGGDLHSLEAIPGLKLEGVRDKWVDMELSELNSQSEVFHVVGEHDKRRLPVSLFMDGFATAAAIFGDPGAGKTTLLKWIASEAVLGRYHLFRVPIYLRLREYAEDYRDQPLTVMRFALTRYGVRDPEVDTEMVLRLLGSRSRMYHSSGSCGVLMLLDGWDEVPPDQRSHIAREIRRMMAVAPCLVTSRPDAMHGLPICKFFRIKPLSLLLMHKLIHGWLPANRARLVKEHLAEYPELEALSQNPFVLTALCGLANLETETPLPQNRRGIYDGILQAICAHFHENHAPDRLDDHIPFCERLAYYILSDAPSAPRLDFAVRDVEAVGGTGEAFQKAIVPSRLVARSSVLPPSFAFLHSTIHEFFAARHLKDTSQLDRIRTLTQAYLHNPRWAGVFQSLADQLSDSEASVRQGFVNVLQEALALPDRFGVTECCVASYLAALRCRDGNVALIGEKIAKHLWSLILINQWSDFVPAVGALARLAPKYLFQEFEALRERNKEESGDKKSKHDQLLKVINDQLCRWCPSIAEASDLRLRFIRKDDPDRQLWRSLPRLARCVRDISDSLIWSVFCGEIPTLPQHEQIRRIFLVSESGDDDAAIALDQLFWRTESEKVREQIIGAFQRMRCQNARDALLSIVAAYFGREWEGNVALGSLAAYPCPFGVELLVKILNDPTIKLGSKNACARALGATAEPRVVDLLSDIASSESYPSLIRVTCVDALAAHGNPSHLEPLLISAKRCDFGKHTSRVTNAIVVIGSRTADRTAFRNVEHVLTEMADCFLHDQDPDIRGHAIKAAGLAGGRFIDDLIAIVRDHSASSDDRSGAALALADADSLRGIDALLELVRDALDRIRKRGNGDFGHAGIDALLRLAPTRLKEYDFPEFEATIARWAQENNALVFESHIVMPFESRTDPSSIGVPGDVVAQAPSKRCEDPPTKQKTKARGRPPIDAIDPARDQQIADAWATKRYEDYTALGHEFEMTRRQIERLMNRVQRRNKRQE